MPSASFSVLVTVNGLASLPSIPSLPASPLAPLGIVIALPSENVTTVFPSASGSVLSIVIDLPS
ncbi:hypothetical protein [Staphylococcus carnosus]|uniref:hypothetical protein n=1 Tax=Staphylococcus carnosus TaxID=1281 RepID=UPI00081A2FEA|nr:hypothetical protein [Staphylococcus carnosus]ANZ32373.1 hypothetical protein BEK99_00175 [Staphylococcus carnosus]UTB79732.1 hypothetical protein A2I65_01905 [Staphylococcus carnosus]UTB84499.1 hypothetical protein A2I66_01800 [Staphylococcus carnosus]